MTPAQGSNVSCKGPFPETCQITPVPLYGLPVLRPVRNAVPPRARLRVPISNVAKRVVVHFLDGSSSQLQPTTLGFRNRVTELLCARPTRISTYRSG